MNISLYCALAFWGALHGHGKVPDNLYHKNDDSKNGITQENYPVSKSTVELSMEKGHIDITSALVLLFSWYIIKLKFILI